MLDVVTEEMAVLLMDHCSSHITNDVIALLTDARVCLITFAPQTTQIFQLFDVTLFSALKQHPRYELPFWDEKAIITCLMEESHGFKQTIIDGSIWRAFQTLEFVFNTGTEPYKLLFNEEKLRETTGSQKLSSIDFPRISCQLAGARLDAIGSTNLSEMACPKHIYVSLIKYQDIMIC
jgi:hypothetical protein